MATIDIRLDGVSITDRVVYSRSNFTSVAGGQPGTATVVIDNSDRGLTTADIDAGTPLELYVDGTREWDGWVMGWSVGWPFQYDDTATPLDTPVFWTLNGMDRNLLFQKRILFRKSDPSSNRGLKIWPIDTPDKTAIEYSLDNYVDFTGDGLSYDIEQIDSPSPWEEFTLGFVSAPLGMLFEGASEMTGGVYWIGPDRTLYYKDDKTVTAPFTLSDTPTGGQVGYRELDAALDYTKAATEALVWGAGKGSAELVFAKYTNDSAASTYGLWQWGDFYAGAWKQETVNRRARTYVIGSPSHRRGHDEPVPTVRCTIFTPGIRAGMVALFVSTLFSYSEALPVRKVTMTFPTPSSVKYELEASLNIDTPWGIPDPWWLDPDDGDTPYREWFDVPGEDPRSEGGDNLIDHFDQLRTSLVSYTPGDLALMVVPQIFEGGISSALVPDGVVEEDATFRPSTTIGAPLHTRAVGGYLRQVDGTEPETPWPTKNETDPFSGTHVEDVHHAKLSSSFSDPLEYSESGMARSSPYTDMQLQAISWGGATRKYVRAAIFIAVDDTSITWTPPTGWEELVRGDLALSGFSSMSYGVFIQTAVQEATNAPGVTGFIASTAAPYQSRSIAITTASDTVTYEADVYDAVLVTPGPSVTGAPWQGGNVWHGTTSSSADGTEVEEETANSIIYGTQTGGYINLYLWDGYKYVTDLFEISDGWMFGEPDTDTQQYEWLAFSTPTYSDGETADTGADILVKWRYNGTTFGTGTGERLYITFDLVELGATPYDTWYTNMLFRIGQQGKMSLYSTPAVMDTGDVGPFFDNGLYSTDTFMYPEAAYFGGAVGPDVQPNTWYWTRMKLGGLRSTRDYGYPYNTGSAAFGGTGYSIAAMKTWAYGTTEPTGDSNLFWWYWRGGGSAPIPVPADVLASLTGGWDIGLPQAWRWNQVTNPPFDDEYVWLERRNVMNVQVNNQSAGDGYFEIDGFWEYKDYLDGAANPIGTGTVTDVPYYDNTENTQNSVYITRFPYVPGTLKVWIEGIRLTSGLDFIETDPASGTFTLTGSRDWSGKMIVEYERNGSAETTGYSGGEVYRPAPVLQYGWGSALDGYNCTMAVGCMALDRHTLGAHTPFTGSPRATPPIMRSYQNDQVGGTDLWDLALAWSNGWGQSLQVPSNDHTWTTFVNYVNGGRGAVLAGTYSQMVSSKRFSASWSGGHALYINERFSNGNFWGYDPLYRYPVVYTEAELQAYALGFVSPGRVTAAFTQVT